jgi:chemotaxis protein histidine kinase CheA
VWCSGGDIELVGQKPNVTHRHRLARDDGGTPAISIHNQTEANLSDSSGASEIPEEVITELVAEYEQGASSRELARRHGYTRQAVRRALEGRVAPREVAPYTPRAPRKRQKAQPKKKTKRKTGRHRNRKQVPLSIPVTEAAVRATERARKREEQYKARVEAEWSKLENLRRLLAQLTNAREGLQSINQEAARINRALVDLVADDPGNMETEPEPDLSVIWPKAVPDSRRYSFPHQPYPK